MSNKNLMKLISDLELERKNSLYPHLVNEKMQKVEMEAGLESLRFYPVYMAIKTIAAYNSRCRFCAL